MSNNSETVRDTRNMSMNHDYETGVALSDSVNKTCMKRPLAEKSRWRHFRLAIKPRYLGNHVSHIKSYFGSLSGSHARSFRIRPKQSSEAPLGEKIMMTSYPACNKTLLSQKPCIRDTKLLWNTIRKLWSLDFRIRHEKSREAPPGGQITMRSYPACKKPRYLENHVSQMKSYNGSLSWSLGRLVIFIKKKQ